MKFECPNCGTVTSSSLSLESGGYWNKYKRSGPWGCPSCRARLDVECGECGAVGTTKTIPHGLCKACQTTECAHCGEKAERRFLVGRLCGPCRQLPIQFQCVTCNAICRLQGNLRGTSAQCPACGVSVVVPDPFPEALRPGAEVLVTGIYQCLCCGPSGKASVLAEMAKLLGRPLSVKENQLVSLAGKQEMRKQFKPRETLPECPNGCGNSTEWLFINPGGKGEIVGKPAQPLKYVIEDVADEAAAIRRACEQGGAEEGILSVSQDRDGSQGAVDATAQTQDNAVAAAIAQLPEAAQVTGSRRR